MAGDELDDVDKQILGILRTNPFLTCEQLVEASPLARNATYRHRQKLEELGYVRNGWIVSPDSDRELLTYCCLINVKLSVHELSKSPLKTAERLIEKITIAVRKPTYAGKLVIEDVYQIFGDSDLVLELLSETQQLAARFIMEQIAMHRGVVSTVTQTAFKWKKHAEWDANNNYG